MNWNALVDRLAAVAGIEPWYYDLGGSRHETTLATKLLVLGALGFDVSSDAAVQASVTAVEETPWRRLLDPFIVQHSDSPVIDLFLPHTETNRSWKWEINFEDGNIVEETFIPRNLALLGVREVDGNQIEHRRLEIGHAGPIGYHRIRIASDWATDSVLAVVPSRCYLPPALAMTGQRLWGVSAHLYTLRSKQNWGIGDFSDLACLCESAGKAGASAIAVNPFHALFPDRPDDASPYSPSSRLFLNPIYIDVAAAPFADECPEIRTLAASLTSLRAADLVDYPKIWRAKHQAFERLFQEFQQRQENVDPTADFQSFVARQGKALEHFTAFSALTEEYGLSWRQWPVHCRKPDTEAIQDFIQKRPGRIAFHRYLQYISDRQLRKTSTQASDAGMALGLVRDLALGVNPDGADAWSQQELFASGLRCGAPPDDFQPHGQEWGVLPLDPIRLRQNMAAFAELLRANMQYAGGLRIDHIIGLQRQFLVPLGAQPSEGCYLRYPFEELLGILALESHRNQCLIVGEDLGTVPEGFRTRMREMDIFGSAILYFERAVDGSFKAPGDYRRKTVVSVGTHDLPPLAGYWEGLDISTRERLGIYTDAEARDAKSQRRHDCARLVGALAKVGLDTGPDQGSSAAMNAPLRRSIHTFLASSSGQLFLAQLDDLVSEREQINVPGTTTSYPNWRRKLSACLEDTVLAAALNELERICTAQSRSRHSPGVGNV